LPDPSGPACSILTGRVALVSGATGPVGRELCHQLASLGAAVAAHCHTHQERAEQLVRTLPGSSRHVWVQGNLADPGQAAAAVAAARASIGPPDVLVDAAYPAAGSRLIRDSDPADLERHLDGFRMHVNACRAVLPGMRAHGRGRIILIAGALATRVFPGFAFYSGMKAGLVALARTLALEEGPAGITVNVIAPGRLESGDGAVAAFADPDFAALDAVSTLRVALPRMAAPHDVASVASFLASDAAAAVTGQVIYLAAGEPV
jgi:NAD(P)-dependent dehydrogenase (short-subunit alcohol dehydrogenase family)